MGMKIVIDSGSNIQEMEGVEFASVPLTIVTEEREFRDDANLDVQEMTDFLKQFQGKSGSACPGVGDWLEAFGDAEEVFCMTIISLLSGSYNAAMIAKEQYEEEHPGRKVYVIDSYSAGPEMKLIGEKLRDLIAEGKDFETICKEIEAYKEEKSCLVFCLQSLKNLANNGRVSHAQAALCSMIGIRIVGDVKDGLHPTDKCRGEKKALLKIVSNMKEKGYEGGTVIIDHCFNESAANNLRNLILGEFPNAIVRVEKTFGLCSFYAEQGGLMIGFEKH